MTKRRADGLERNFGHLYEFRSLGNRMACAYCGDVRESVDHVPPLAVVGLVGTAQLRERGVKFFTLPCCRSCNQTLSARMLATYEERLGFLYRKLLDKSDRLPYWTEEEAEDAQLRGELRRMVLARSEHTRREVLVRLRGMERNLCNIEKIVKELL